MNTRVLVSKLAPASRVSVPTRRNLLQRKCACGGTPGPSGECEECRKEKLQPKARNSEPGNRDANFAPKIVHKVLRSPGQPLDPGTRALMEPRFRHDFSRVRVHTDPLAAESARAVNALAYTVGRDVVFGSGQYAPTTLVGKKLLAHELTHVVQQRAAGSLAIQRQAPEEEKKPAADELPKAAAETGTEATAAEGVVAEVAAEPAVVDGDIDALDLTATAKAAAQDIKKKHPEITFSSGRRTVAEQADAMASNIVSSENRKWIEKTYKSAASLQKWVDDNPEAKTVDDISDGLESTMNAMSESDRGKVSKHFSGKAFDVQPQDKDADAIKTDMRALSGLSEFLEEEGGLVRWHAQFKRVEEVRVGYDRYEQEADRVANQVVGRMIGGASRLSASRLAAWAAESARAVNALAYTVGQDLVFAAGEYQPGTPVGLRLLAHELTHTVQHGRDGSGPNNSTPGTGPLRLDGSADSPAEREAERIASNAMMPGGHSSVAMAPIAVRAQPGQIYRAETQTTSEDNKEWTDNVPEKYLLDQLGMPTDQLAELEGEADKRPGQWVYGNFDRWRIRILRNDAGDYDHQIWVPKAQTPSLACTCPPRGERGRTPETYDAETIRFVTELAPVVFAASERHGVPPRATAGAIADEYNTQRGVEGVGDRVLELQDLLRDDFSSTDINSFWDWRWKIVNPLEDDVGKANFKVRTALERVRGGELRVPGTPPSDVQVYQIVVFLLRDEFMVEATAVEIARGQRLYGPYMSDYDEGWFEAVLVEHFKQGTPLYDKFLAKLEANPTYKPCPGFDGCDFLFNHDRIQAALEAGRSRKIKASFAPASRRGITE